MNCKRQRKPATPRAPRGSVEPACWARDTETFYNEQNPNPKPNKGRPVLIEPEEGTSVPDA